MKIKDIGGEFELIKRITGKAVNDKNVIKGIGDDCAVIYNGNKYLLVTTDMMVENDHFNLKWQTPQQVGMKLMEANVSDIVSMGGKPTYAFISMSLTKETSVELIEGIYEGLHISAKIHKVIILGGDTTHGTEHVFNLTLLGEVDKSLVKYRSCAREGDIICVTGKLGGSTAGLKLLLNNKDGYLLDHLEPKSRLASEGEIISRYANSMIDVSDGLGSEVRHICEESNVGARIDYDKIPLSDETIKSAEIVGENPEDFALYGGEDFELVFTIPQNKINFLKKEFNEFSIVGEILDSNKGFFILKNNKKVVPKSGYNHFG